MINNNIIVINENDNYLKSLFTLGLCYSCYSYMDINFYYEKIVKHLKQDINDELKLKILNNIHNYKFDKISLKDIIYFIQNDLTDGVYQQGNINRLIELFVPYHFDYINDGEVVNLTKQSNKIIFTNYEVNNEQILDLTNKKNIVINPIQIDENVVQYISNDYTYTIQHSYKTIDMMDQVYKILSDISSKHFYIKFDKI